MVKSIEWNNGNGTTAYRLDQLERNYDRLDTKMSLILENHLPHIQEDIVALKTRITVLTAFNIGAIIIGVAMNKLLQWHYINGL